MRLASDHWLADRNSACPAVTVPSKRHQTPLASQAHPLLVSIVFIFDWCSYCTPQAGTATNVVVTVRYKLVLPPTSQLLYATCWCCHQRCSYCTPQAGTTTNVAAQAGTATKGAVTVRHKLVLPPTVQLLYPQAGTATNGAVTVRHKLVLPPIKPFFVFLFCYPKRGPSLL